MKRIETNRNGIKELFHKRPALVILSGIVMMLLISLAAYFSLIKMSKDVTASQSSPKLAPTSAADVSILENFPDSTAGTNSDEVSDSSGGNSSDDVTEYSKELQAADEIQFTYPDDTSLTKDNTILYTCSQKTEHEDIKAAIMKILNLLPAAPSDEKLGKGELLTIQYRPEKSNTVISVFKPADGLKTVFKIQKDGKQPQFYSCGSSVYDQVLNLIRPYTLDAAKTMAESFLKALARKDTKAMESLMNNYTLFGKWTVLGSDGGSIKNMTLEPVEGNSKAFKVTFDVNGGDSYPFLTGHNERILEISQTNGSSGVVLHFIDAAAYVQTQKEPETMCDRFYNDVSQDAFSSVSGLDQNKLLGYILQYEKGSLEVSDNLRHFTQADVDSYANSLFGIDHIDGTNSDFYHVNGDYYYGGSYAAESNGMRGGPVRVNSVTLGEKSDNYLVYLSADDDQGNCSVTVETFIDSLDALPKNSLRYDLQKNDDGTYRFIRAVNLS